MKKENEAIKDRIIRDFRNLFGYEEDHYETVGARDFWSNKNYIEYIVYKSYSDRNRSLSVEEYLNKIRSYLKEKYQKI